MGAVDISFVEHVDGLQYDYPIFGGNGVHNLFVLYSSSCYSKVNSSLHVAYSTVTKYYYFSHQ